MTNSVFISYRRVDTAGHAGALYRDLRHSFKQDEIFFDTATIDIGVSFPRSISRAIYSAKVIIIVIGPDWLSKLIERDGDSRIDYVYEEVRIALLRLELSGAPLVIPVVVGGACWPDCSKIGGKIGRLIDNLGKIQSHHIQGTQAEIDSQYHLLKEKIAKSAELIASEHSLLDATTRTWHVPFSRNIHFSGREEELNLLRTTFAEIRTEKLIALVGLGGIGKTQLALEYVYRWKAEYSGVWWFRAETSNEYFNDISLLCKALGLNFEYSDLSRLTENFRSGQVEIKGRWLFIFDNVADPVSFKAMRPNSRCPHHYIITSRHAGNWLGIADTVSLLPLRHQDAVSFLLARTDQQDAQAAARLVKTLGGLPLAIEQAAATIDSLGVTIDQYSNFFATSSSLLLKSESSTADYPHSVSTTWEVALEKVREQTPLGESLLNLLVFYASDKIPQDIVKCGESALPTSMRELGSNHLVLAETVGVLRRFSLINSEMHAWSVHRLVQLVTRDRLDTDVARWASIAVRLIHNIFAFDNRDPNTWEATGALLPHAIAAASNAIENKCSSEQSADLLNEAAGYMYVVNAQPDHALDLLNQSLSLDETTFGSNHPRVASRLSNIASVLQRQGKLRDALQLAKRACKIDKGSLGDIHKAIAQDENNIGQILLELGLEADAAKHTLQALEIAEKVHSADHPDVGTIASNMGSIYKAIGDHEKALTYTKRAVRIHSNAYGECHTLVATDLIILAQILQDNGELSKALSYAERAHEIYSHTYESDHLNIADSAGAISQILKAQGNLDASLQYANDALKIHLDVYGTKSRAVATDYNNIAVLLDEKGKKSEAEMAYEKSLDSLEKMNSEVDSMARSVKRNLKSLVWT